MTGFLAAGCSCNRCHASPFGPGLATTLLRGARFGLMAYAIRDLAA